MIGFECLSGRIAARWYNLFMRSISHGFFVMSILALALSSCKGVTPDEPGDSSSFITLLPYQADVTTQIASSQPESTASPSSTAEPVIYTVVSGDSMSTIAFRFGVDLNALILANPKVDPNAMSIGTRLVIPPRGDANGTSINVVMGLPTPVVQTDKGPDCYRTDDSQWICFLLVHNDHADAVGNIFGQVMQIGSSSSFTAVCPLDLIPAGESLPLIARIQNVEIDPARMEGRLTTALPINATDARYAAVDISKQSIDYSTDHRSAEISGELLLPSGGAPRLLVYAQDSNNHVVGFRVWDAGVSVQAGMTQSFHLYLYSLGGVIADIHLVAQARQQ
jgi:LysM repeat protein